MMQMNNLLFSVHKAYLPPTTILATSLYLTEKRHKLNTMQADYMHPGALHRVHTA